MYIYIAKGGKAYDPIKCLKMMKESKLPSKFQLENGLNVCHLLIIEKVMPALKYTW